MKYLLFIIIFIYSCENSNKEVLSQEKITQLETNFKSIMMSEDSTYRLDSFKFIRLDTITAKQKIGILIQDLSEEIDHLNNLIESQNEVAASRIKLAQLYGYFSSELSKLNKDNAREELAKSETYIQQSKQLIQQKDSLLNKYFTSDSTKAVAYNAVNLFQFRKIDESVIRDTARILLNLNKDIITKEEFLK